MIIQIGQTHTDVVAGHWLTAGRTESFREGQYETTNNLCVRQPNSRHSTLKNQIS